MIICARRGNGDPVLTICMPSGNDGRSGGAGREMGRGKRVPGGVAVLVVMEEGRGGGGKTTEYDVWADWRSVEILSWRATSIGGLAVPTIHTRSRSNTSATRAERSLLRGQATSRVVMTMILHPGYLTLHRYCARKKEQAPISIATRRVSLPRWDSHE